MKQYKSAFMRYTEAMEKTGDIVLAYWYQRRQIMDELLSEREIDRIAYRVIERINITIDANDIIDEIDGIQERLNKLGE